MKQFLFPNNLLINLAFGYLLLPFIIFCLTFLKIWIGIPMAFILGWITIRIRKQGKSSQGFGFSKSDLILGLLVLGLWVLLSGIGGFAFQNSDFHFRNAIFNDLVNFSWPVYYSSSTGPSTNSAYALTYYIGFWLPAALVGKLIGTHAGNLFLFVWGWSGVFLTCALLKERIKSSFLAASLLLIFFSGMDILGTLLMQVGLSNQYPTLWPPITHLEWWSSIFQFSSFTTQLFWVFNQAIPAWICTALILNSSNRRHILFIWALCFFYAPIPAIGLLPFVFLAIPRKAFTAENIFTDLKGQKLTNLLKNSISDVRKIVNLNSLLGGGLVLTISFLYFSTNPSASKIEFIILNPVIVLFLVVFLIIEFILLWLLFYKEQKGNLWWYATGGTLLVCGLIRAGGRPDFCMRASIPALMILMIWSGEALFRRPIVKYRGALILLLILGAFTPIYELNRSAYRTINFYFSEPAPVQTNTITQGIEKPNPIPELDHPLTLTADLYPSLTIFNPDDLSVFVGKTINSFFFRYLAQSP